MVDDLNLKEPVVVKDYNNRSIRNSIILIEEQKISVENKIPII